MEVSGTNCWVPLTEIMMVKKMKSKVSFRWEVCLWSGEGDKFDFPNAHYKHSDDCRDE